MSYPLTTLGITEFVDAPAMFPFLTGADVLFLFFVGILELTIIGLGLVHAILIILSISQKRIQRNVLK